MKIIGGSFGLKGKARFAGSTLEVIGTKKADYRGADITALSFRTEGQKKFGLIGAIIGAVVLGFIAGLFLGPIGWLIGIVLAIAGSFYSTKKHYADLEFSDGAKLNVELNDHEAKKLVKLRG